MFPPGWNSPKLAISQAPHAESERERGREKREEKAKVCESFEKELRERAPRASRQRESAAEGTTSDLKIALISCGGAQATDGPTEGVDSYYEGYYDDDRDDGYKAKDSSASPAVGGTFGQGAA